MLVSLAREMTACKFRVIDVVSFLTVKHNVKSCQEQSRQLT